MIDNPFIIVFALLGFIAMLIISIISEQVETANFFKRYTDNPEYWYITK